MERTKIKKSEILKIVLFLAMTAGLIWYAYHVLVFPQNAAANPRGIYNAYIAEPEDSLDVVFVGSSATNRYWAPAIGWERAGFTSANFTSDGSPMHLTKYMIEEALKTQDPEVLFVELRMYVPNNRFDHESQLRRITSCVAHGKTLDKVADTIVEYAEDYDAVAVNPEDKSYRYPFLKNHNRWATDFTLENLYNLYPAVGYKGFIAYATKNVWNSNPQAYPELTEETTEMSEANARALNELMDYCDTLDTKVVFLVTPSAYFEEEFKRINAAKEYVEERGYEVVDMNSEEIYEEIGLDFDTDLYNYKHTNVLGAIKTSAYMADYLSERYELPDHREEAEENPNSELAKSWKNSYEELEARIKEMRPEWVATLQKACNKGGN